jgi:uncharacterized protein YcfJ
MEMNQLSRHRIHPLMAGAAVSVMLVSLIGIAAMTGVLPNSHASAAETARITAAETARMTAQAAAVAPLPAPAQQLVATNASPDYKQPYGATASAPAQHAAMAPAVRDEGSTHKPVVHHRPHPVQHAQAQSGQQYSQQPAPAPAPVARYSPLGIGVGAVVGGLLGNQVGGGTGKTLATVAGAVGGGYVGNEIAKRNP